MITIDEIRARVQEIRDMAHDAEWANSLEDDLRDDVLRAIADGASDAAALADAALETSEIEFARWYA